MFEKAVSPQASVVKAISGSGKTLAEAITDYVVYGEGGSYVRSTQFQKAVTEFKKSFSKTVQALAGERSVLYGQDDALVAQVKSIASGDYSFMMGLANSANDNIINNRYAVRDAVGAAMEDTLTPDALGRIAQNYAGSDGNFDLIGFVNNMADYYVQNGNLGEYAQFFVDSGAKVIETIKKFHGANGAKVSYSLSGETVFPQGSQASEVAIRWAYDSVFANGARRIVFFNDTAYLIKKDESLDLRYFVVKKLSKKEMNRIRRHIHSKGDELSNDGDTTIQRRRERTVSDSNESRTVSESREGNYYVDTGFDRYGRKVERVGALDNDENRQRKFGRDRSRNNQYGIENWGNEIKEGESYEQTEDLLSDGSGERQNRKSARKSVGEVDGRTSRYRESKKAKRKRIDYCRELRKEGKTKRLNIYEHECDVIVESDYTLEMKRIVETNKSRGISNTILVVGGIKLPMISDSEANVKTARGMIIEDNGETTIVIQCDNEFVSPKQINDHEYVHMDYNSERMKKIKALILGSLSDEEKKAVLDMYSMDYRGIIEGNEDKLYEEFIANVLSGHQIYAIDFTELVNAYWSGDDKLIDNFKVAEYKKSIDSGGRKKLIHNGVFLPENEIHSKAHEYAARWAYDNRVEDGAKRIVACHDVMYIVKKDISREYMYRIVDEVLAGEYEKGKWRFNANDKDTRRKSEPGFFDIYTERSEQGDSFEYGGQSIGADSIGYRREGGNVLSVVGDEVKREKTGDNFNRDNEYDSEDRERSSLGLVSDNKSEITIKYSADSSVRDSYSTQKIIEAKALATDDSELIEAAKENTKQVQSYVRSNKDLQKRLENAKRQMTRSKAPRVNVNEVAKVTKQIISDLQGTVKAADLKDDVTAAYNEYYSDVKKAGRVQSKVDEATDRLVEKLNVIAAKIINSAETTVESEDYVQLREWLKETRIKVPDDAKAEAEFAGKRKAYFGTLNLTNDGIAIDSAYQELCELFPYRFKKEVTAPADQLNAIVDALESTRPDVYNPYAKDMEGAIEYAAYQFVSALDGIAVMPDTKADRAAKKAAYDKEAAVEKARKHFEDRMAKNKEKSDAQIAKLREQLSAAKYTQYWERRLSNEERVQAVKEIREKRKISILKSRIRKIVSELNNGLNKTEKAGGYPKELVKAVADVCSAIDFHTDKNCF